MMNSSGLSRTGDAGVTAAPLQRAEASRRIGDEALAAYAVYLEAFNARDAAKAARFYAAPMQVVTQRGHRMLSTQAEVEAMLARSLAALDAKDFASTRFGRKTLRVMNDNTVLLSADFLRSRADGSTIETIACTYVMSRGESGWAIVTMIVHPPESVLP